MTTIIDIESLNRLRVDFESANYGRDTHELDEHLRYARSFFSYIPEFAACSHDLKCEIKNGKTYVMRDYDAVRQPWFTADTKHLRRTIALDIDHTDGFDKWFALPERYKPHLVIDPWSDRSCAIFALALPVDYSEKYSDDQELCESTARLLAEFFQATIISRHVAHKNPVALKSELIYPLKRRTPTPGPLYEAWEESGSEYLWITKRGAIDHDLDALHDFFCEIREVGEWQREIDAEYRKAYRLQKPPKSNRSTQEQVEDGYATGRNVGIFTELRFWSYRNYPACIESGVIEEKADSLNAALAKPIDAARLTGIAWRVRKFMEEDYNPGGARDINFGVMQLYKTELKLPEKQQKAAGRTNQIRSEKVLEALRIAAAAWPDGKKMTQAAMAMETGKGIATVKRYWHVICP